MNKRKNKKINLLLVLLLTLSIGFAALATTLKINGTANIGKNTWNVYWDRIANLDGVTPEDEPDIGPDENSVPKSVVTWEVDLNTPGDYFEFTVDAVNAGTIDAEITEIISKYGNTVIPDVIDQEHPSPVPSYIKYSVVYADNGEKPAVGEKLAKASDPTDESTFTRKTYKIRVEYDKDAVTNSIINEMDDEGESHTFSFSVKYGQATPSEEDPIAEIIAEIEADPESHRNPEQSASNTDIGIDENGNVINLDLWAYQNEWMEEPVSCYGKRSIYDDETGNWITFDEIVLGGTGSEGDFAMATASENIVNGELQTPIPAYIMLAGTNEFYPVTEVLNLFGRQYYEGWDEPISKFPNLPTTVKIIGEHTFRSIEAFENLVIPKQIEYIDFNAFYEAFNPEGENNTLTFEEGSQLKEIGMAAFDDNYIKNSLVFPSTLQRIEEYAFRNNELSGNLVLPDSVNYIGYESFTNNNLTSVSFPTSADYFVNYYTPEEHYGPYNTFDEEVTIIRR